MTGTVTPSSPPGSTSGERAARVLSEVLAPWVCAAALPPVIGAMTTQPWWQGVLHGLLVTVISAGLPYAVVRREVRAGRISDHHVSRREDRPRLLAVAGGCVLVALVVVSLLGATAATRVFVLLMLASVGVGAVVSRWWKISMHALVLASSVTVLAGLQPVLLPLAVTVPAVAWARWRLRCHTPAQLVAGTLVGVALAAVALTLAG